MIQDIQPHVLRNEFIPGRGVEPEGWLFLFRDEDVLCTIENGTVRLPRVKDLPEEGERRYLFALDDVPCYLGMEALDQLANGMEWVSVRQLRRLAEGPREAIFATWTAFQLYNWYRDNRFCGRCGVATFPAPDERAMECPHCKRRIYPRIIPAVIVGVTNGDEILMTRYNGRDIPYYALVAGFTEIGETLEQTVAREVMEETGLRVKNIRYYKSQPWAIVDDLLAGFYCDVDGDTQIHMDERELKEAVWVRRGDVVGQPNDYSLTNEMMLLFRDGKEPR
ncbi:MAG: NAD(+) diphosphatase [Clostridia bacterium]|nr:NAD(+) diphosphatase [Clostridia bacterium]